jgi:hydroxymethylglutaryl-CoA reductase
MVYFSGAEAKVFYPKIITAFKGILPYFERQKNCRRYQQIKKQIEAISKIYNSPGAGGDQNEKQKKPLQESFVPKMFIQRA